MAAPRDAMAAESKKPAPASTEAAPAEEPT